MKIQRSPSRALALGKFLFHNIVESQISQKLSAWRKMRTRSSPDFLLIVDPIFDGHRTGIDSHYVAGSQQLRASESRQRGTGRSLLRSKLTVPASHHIAVVSAHFGPRAFVGCKKHWGAYSSAAKRCWLLKTCLLSDQMHLTTGEEEGEGVQI